MSIELVARVLNTPTGLGSTAKMVLLGLANHAGPDGERVFPSVARLGRYAECDERTVKRHLKALRVAGWIEVVAKASQHRPTQYRIRSDRLSSLESRGDISGTPRGDTAMSPEPSVEPSLTTSVAPLRKPDPIFETLAAIEGSDLADLTRSHRGALNKAAKELRDLGVTPQAIAVRARAFGRRYPGATLTALALVRHWAELNGRGVDTRPDWQVWEEALGE